MPEPVRVSFLRQTREDAAAEFRTLAADLRYSRLAQRLRRASWRIEGTLLAWTEGVEPSNDYAARLLAETDDGTFLMPAAPRDGEPWWQGRWRWYRLDHWPVYLRSRRARSYVMVETC